MKVMDLPAAAPTQTSVDFQGSHLKDYWNILLRRKWLVLSFCLIGTVSIGVLSFMMTPLYKASTTIVIEGEGSDVLDPSQSSARGMSFEIFDNYVQTQMSLIQSRSIAGEVFKELNLDELPRYQQEPNPFKRFYYDSVKKVKGFLLGPGAVSERKGDQLQRFLDDVEVERLKGTRAIRISVYNPDAELAATIANALAERYGRDNLKRRALTYIRNQRMASLNADYLRLQSRYDSLSTQYGPMHHEMIALKNEIRSLAKSIEEQAAEIEKQHQLDEQRLANAKSGEEEELMLKDILKRIQESSVFSSSQMNNIVVADPAVPPSHIAKPKKILNILIGMIGGLIAGIFLAFFVEYLDDTVKSEEDLKKAIGNAPFLGTVPYDKYTKGFSRISKLDRLIVNKPLSESAEAYRLVRIQLQWLMKKDPNFKDFAMVSSIPDEGKTTISSNLAICLSQLDKKVLLVDCDIRRGRLHRTYGTQRKKGLGQYLTEDMMFHEIVQKTKIPNLWIVTPGESLIMRSELLSSDKMSEFIETTREYFDIVLYDTPPITLISDTSVLLSQLHGAILVSRTGHTRSRLIPKSLSMIRNANTNLIGVLLNSAVSTDNKYYHRYYRD